MNVLSLAGESRPPLAGRPLPDDIGQLLANPPQRTRGLNRWFFATARKLQAYRSAEETVALLRSATADVPGVKPGEIERAVERSAPFAWKPTRGSGGAAVRGGGRSPSEASGVRSRKLPPGFGPARGIRPPPLAFQPGRLAAETAGQGDLVTRDWLREHSPVRPDILTAAEFLSHLYRPGEQVRVFDDQQSQGCGWRYRPEGVCNPASLAFLATGRPGGAWFLVQPVDGQLRPNDDGKPSYRSRQNVTAWRYALLESDGAPEDRWLTLVAQVPLPVVSIVTSGGKSIHVLIRVDADSKEAWDRYGEKLKARFVPLGADPAALTAVRLSRLPGCERGETGQRQELLFLNPAADGTPIVELPPPTWLAAPGSRPAGEGGGVDRGTRLNGKGVR